MSPHEAERRNSKRRVSQLVAALMRGPSSISQLATLTGYSYSNVQTWVESFHDLGLCFIESWEVIKSSKQHNVRHYTRIFRWCDGEPFSRHDAEKPHSVWLPKGIKPSTKKRYDAVLATIAANPDRTFVEIAKEFGCCTATVSRASSWQKMKHREAAKAQARAAIATRGKTA